MEKQQGGIKSQQVGSHPIFANRAKKTLYPAELQSKEAKGQALFFFF